MGRGSSNRLDRNFPQIYNLLLLITGSPTHFALWGQTAQPLLVDSGALPTAGKGPQKVPGHSKDWPIGLRRLALFCWKKWLRENLGFQKQTRFNAGQHTKCFHQQLP